MSSATLIKRTAEELAPERVGIARPATVRPSTTTWLGQNFNSGGVAVVVFQEPANALPAANVASSASDAGFRLDQCITKSLMIAFMVIVLHEFASRRQERLFSEGYHSVGTFAFEASEEAFHVGIQIRRAGGQADSLNTAVMKGADEGFP